MNDFLSQTFYGNTILDWFISCGVFLASIVIAKTVYWIIGKYVKKITARTKSDLDDLLVAKLEDPIVYGLVIIGFYWGFLRLDFSKGVDNFFQHLFTIVFILNITWLIVRVLDSLIIEYIFPLVSKSKSDLDNQLLPVMRKMVKIILWSVGIIIGLNNAGFDVAALIAGLGIGGLALALAAQDTVKNIFGGMMIFIDRPFKITDRIKIDSWDGVVEEIGIRSTRIRTLEGRLVTMPNARFSENAVENITLEPSRKVITNLGLTYETGPKKMKQALELLKNVALSNENVTDNITVSFNAWGTFSMGVLFVYYIKAGSDVAVTQSEINLEVLRQFNEAGIDFAYPTQTIYNKIDSKLQE